MVTKMGFRQNGTFASKKEADDEFVVVLDEDLRNAADPEPEAVFDHASGCLSVIGAEFVKGGRMAKPDNGAKNDDVGDTVGKDTEKECQFAITKIIT